MRYLKTFESHSINEEEGLNKKIFTWMMLNKEKRLVL